MNNVVNIRNYNISPKVDAIIDRLEAGGLAFCVINLVPKNQLVFEFNQPVVTSDAWLAAQELNHIFTSDGKLSEDIFYHAFDMGAVFQELKSVEKGGVS